jgi:hypothetical protein
VRNRFLYILIIIFSTFGLVGCKEHYVNFFVINNSTDTIKVQYNYSSTTNDTILINMYPNYSYAPYNFIHTKVDPSNTDWWAHNAVTIQSITNMAGDTINFDPNSQSNWHYEDAVTYHNYKLIIDDASF